VSERGTYLDVGDEAVFVAHHTPEVTDPLRTAVVLLPPLGWEETATHRAWREWAIDLARRGHHALRIDLPGTTDSAGELNDPGRWGSWLEAACVAASWLRSESGAWRLAVLGLGSGGYLAFEAVAARAADEAVLWATPSRGKVFLRELNAFGALEMQRVAESGGPPSPEPASGIEAGGYIIEEELASAIRAVDLEARPLPASARILLAGRDGAGRNARFEEVLRHRAVDVETTDGRGYAAMVVQPDLSAPPRELFAIVADWLERGAASTVGGDRQVRRPGASAASLGDAVEQPFVLERPSGNLRGVLVEPVGAEVQPLTLVFLNAGAIPRTGPNRLWVSWSRDWARRGIPSLRLDNEGIGDADGDGERYRDVARFHDPQLVSHVSAALDALVERGFPPRFVTIGLCSGGCWAFQTALAHNRVAAAVMLNTRVLYWHEHLEPARDLRRTRLLVRPITWKRLLRGDVPVRRWRGFAGWMALSAAARLRRGDGRVEERSVFGWQARQAATGFTSLREAGKRAHFVFCGGEPLDNELTEAGLFAQRDRWPNVTRREIPGREHTLKPVWMHRYAGQAFDEVVQSELERIADEIASPA